jgi:hypothetical protein
MNTVDGHDEREDHDDREGSILRQDLREAHRRVFVGFQKGIV